jgi:hypothetical protein
MKTLIVLHVAVLVLVANSPAPVADLARETSDAYHILLQNRYEGDFIPDSQVTRILAELRAIRATDPEMANVHETGSFLLY